MRRSVYAVTGVRPEIAAYGMARYSRSAQSLRDSLREISAEQTSTFLNTYYYRYGHKSIADLAHIMLAIENISIWSAMILVDEPLWDGQERSTRYQPFANQSFYVPPDAPPLYTSAIQALFREYRSLHAEMVHAYRESYPRPASLPETAYERTIRARAFDVARLLLPLAAQTSLGQVTSARVLERQIGRLSAHALPEVKAIAEDMRVAITTARPYHLGLDRLPPEDAELQKVYDALDVGPVAPTLAKHCEPQAYPRQLHARLTEYASTHLPRMPVSAHQPVTLTTNETPVDAACATLLYSATHYPYPRLAEFVRQLSLEEKNRVLYLGLADRGSHDEWAREFQTAPLAFDILTDIGSFRDLNRHRRATKIPQDLTPVHGLYVPGVLEAYGLTQRYSEVGAAAMAAVAELGQAWDPLQSLYALPLAAKRRALFRMDIAEAAYIIELRTRSAGHFAYREVAYRMFEQLASACPSLAQHIKPTNPREDSDFFDR